MVRKGNWGGGGYSWGRGCGRVPLVIFGGGLSGSVLQTVTLFQTKICNFALSFFRPFSDLVSGINTKNVNA